MATTLAARTIDPVPSSVEFSLDYMGFSTDRTGVRALEGSLLLDSAGGQCVDPGGERRHDQRSSHEPAHPRSASGPA
jgi:hypothetical protein